MKPCNDAAVGREARNLAPSASPKRRSRSRPPGPGPLLLTEKPPRTAGREVGMSKAQLRQSRPGRLIGLADRGLGTIAFGPTKCRAKAWEYVARAQVVSDPEQRAELLRFAGAK
jgi:hypothetical protein